MAVTTVDVGRRHLLSSDEAARTVASVIGGKAAGLARLGQLGARVPAWAVVPASVMREEIQASRLDKDVERILADLASTGERSEVWSRRLSTASTELRGIVAALTFDDMLLEALAEASALVGDGQLAVRSSAVGEDGDAYSYAGQFDTILHVRGEGALADAVRACWASAFSVRALDYRLRNATIDRAPDLAVIIQRMVDGEVSGVLFTADPSSGDVRRVHISACRGLGDRLVSGAVDVDEVVTDRAGLILESRRCADTPAIDAATVRSLVRSAVSIADAENGPRDIEWTVAGGEIWFLQSRPVARRASPPCRVVWDNSNIQESYCGVTTPLTFSFARAAYAVVYAQTMRAVGIRQSVINQHRDVLYGLLGLIHGRVYYNLNHWYRGLLLLPAFRRNKADMERMMGVGEPVDFVQDETPAWTDRLRRAPAMLLTALHLVRRFTTIERDSAAFLTRFDTLLTGIDRSTIETRPLDELAGLLRLLRRDGIQRWTTPIVNDFRVMMTTGRLRRFVERGGGDDVDRVMQTLLGGADVAVSSAPAMVMLRMADAARRSPPALAALTDGRPDGLARAASASSELGALLRDLLDNYGDRCMGELKLESRSLRDDPGFVTAMLLNYLRADRADGDGLARKAREQRAAVEAGLVRRMGPLTRARFRRALRSARVGIRAREVMRLARTRLFGVHRQIYRAIGTRFHEQGRLDDPAGVLYLTVDEIMAQIEITVETGDREVDLAATARARRATFAGYGELPAPNRIVTATVPDPFAPAVDVGLMRPVYPLVGGRILRGLGCSAGIAEGPVRIVTGPDDDLSINGHVLVATRTDPGWSPLFHSAAAILVERGSVLSHSAVLARELGLPAVVGIPGLVATLRNGERVRIDGSAGTVERLDPV